MKTTIEGVKRKMSMDHNKPSLYQYRLVDCGIWSPGMGGKSETLRPTLADEKSKGRGHEDISVRVPVKCDRGRIAQDIRGPLGHSRNLMPIENVVRWHRSSGKQDGWCQTDDL